MKRALQLTVDGEEYEVLADTHRTLLEVLRDSLGRQGPKRDVPDEVLNKLQPVFYTDPINAAIRAMGLE